MLVIMLQYELSVELRYAGDCLQKVGLTLSFVATPG